MGQMCNHMGAGAPGFAEQALRFHHTADTIAEAARKRDMQGVLSALGATLATCTGCHATFKQRIVDGPRGPHWLARPPPSIGRSIGSNRAMRATLKSSSVKRTARSRCSREPGVPTRMRAR